MVIPETCWEQKKADVHEYHIDTLVKGNDWTEKFDFLKKEVLMLSVCQKLLRSIQHKSNTVFITLVFGVASETRCKGTIFIDNNVWIGHRAAILYGVHWGQGCIIGVNSAVVKDVLPYAFYEGGQVVKYRFEEPICDKLLELYYSALHYGFLKQNFGLLFEPIGGSNADQIVRRACFAEAKAGNGSDEE